MTVLEGSSDKRELRAGTRRSALAGRQTRLVLDLLRDRWPQLVWREQEYSTHGDELAGKSLVEIGGRGVFTERIEGALTCGEIDFAVHSLKDLPVEPPPGLLTAAVVGPRNPGEVLVSRSGGGFRDLAPGAVIGTSSLRRRAQILAARPDLAVHDIRGNVETRIEKVRRGDYDAAVLAAAGIERLGLEAEVAEYLPLTLMLPAPGQGAIAVQCRAEERLIVSLLSAIDDAELAGATRAERAFLKALGGGCSAPVAAYAERATDGGKSGGIYHLTGRVIAPDGSRAIEVKGDGEDAAELGERLAREALAQGAGEILAGALDDRIFRGKKAQGDQRPIGALEGKRVVVTRPLAKARDMAEALEGVGAQVIMLPVIETHDALDSVGELDAAGGIFANLNEFRWLVFASAAAVEHFLPAARRASVEVTALTGRVAAVGPATAAALDAAGVRPQFVASGRTGADLARELPDVASSKVLLPCAVHHGGELPAILGERGAQVTVFPVYRTEAVPIDGAGIAELRKGVDLVLFTSGSTVRGFIDGVRRAAGEPLLGQVLSHARIACIGPSTAAKVRARGYTPHIIAADHTGTGLVSAILSDAGKEA